MQPPTVSPRWGTWFLDWKCAKDPWEAFDIWRNEMYSDYEWFFDYCEGDDYDTCVIVDWYYRWSKVSLAYRISLRATVFLPNSVLYYLKRLKKIFAK